MEGWKNELWNAFVTNPGGRNVCESLHSSVKERKHVGSISGMWERYEQKGLLIRKAWRSGCGERILRVYRKMCSDREEFRAAGKRKAVCSNSRERRECVCSRSPKKKTGVPKDDNRVAG